MTPERPVTRPHRKTRMEATPPRADVTFVLRVMPELQVPERKGLKSWPDAAKVRAVRWLSNEELISDRLRQAALALRNCVEVNARKLGGVPTLRGARFSVAQVLSQMAEGDTIDDLAENFDLDRKQLATLLHALSAYLNRPFYR